MERSAFISGITGFIGRPLSAWLAERGYAVSGLARQADFLPGRKLILGDIAASPAYQDEASSCRLVVHLAAPTVASYIADHPLETMSSSLIGLLNMLDCFAAGSGQHFVFISSGKVYGHAGKLPMPEDAPLDPVGPLGQVKHASEGLIHYFARHCPGKRFSILRLFNGYGPGQKSDFLIPTILAQLPSGNIVLGDVSSKRDFIYIDDIVEGIGAVVAANDAGRQVQIFNLGSGLSHSPADLVHVLEGIAGHKLAVVSNPDKVRKGEMPEERADVSSLQSLGWNVKTDIKTGLLKTWSQSHA